MRGCLIIKESRAITYVIIIIIFGCRHAPNNLTDKNPEFRLVLESSGNSPVSMEMALFRKLSAVNVKIIGDEKASTFKINKKIIVTLSEEVKKVFSSDIVDKYNPSEYNKTYADWSNCTVYFENKIVRFPLDSEIKLPSNIINLLYEIETQIIVKTKRKYQRVFASIVSDAL